LVVWLALPLQQGSTKVALNPPVPRPPVLSNRGAVNDYLTAHQEFSPSTAMQGLAPYVRTVSADESNPR
jgi:sigma-E factor negative regulatory protein RseA